MSGLIRPCRKCREAIPSNKGPFQTGVRTKMWYSLHMDNKPTLLDERKKDREAYKNGVRDGMDQAVWLAVGVAVIIILVT